MAKEFGRLSFEGSTTILKTIYHFEGAPREKQQGKNYKGNYYHTCTFLNIYKIFLYKLYEKKDVEVVVLLPYAGKYYGVHFSLYIYVFCCLYMQICTLNMNFDLQRLN